MNNKTHATIDEYIQDFPRAIQLRLRKVRATIKKAAPGAGEKISYRMPTFTFHGNLVHFAAFKAHIGFFPTSSGIRHFRKELAGFETSRGTVRFPFTQEIPFSLIRRIVRFRVKENRARAKAKK
jgi:uncharacterized protein YdhG (YjbR/CyaY superfamily)